MWQAESPWVNGAPAKVELEVAGRKPQRPVTDKANPID
jgi:hypothetical protein